MRPYPSSLSSACACSVAADSDTLDNSNSAFRKHNDANSNVAAGIAGVPTLKCKMFEIKITKLYLQGMSFFCKRNKR